MADVSGSQDYVKNECGNPEELKEWAIQNCYLYKAINSNNPSCRVSITNRAEWIYSTPICSAYHILSFENYKLKSIEFKR